MPAQPDSYAIHPYPLQRRIIADTVRTARRKNAMYGLIEFDITDARRAVRAHRNRTGAPLSFNTFMIACLGRAIGQHRAVQGILNWREQVVVFDDVDIATMVEIDASGEKFPLAHVIRGANRRSLAEIQSEIRGIQTDPQAMAHAENTPFMAVFLRLPVFVRDAIYSVLLRSPRLMKRTIGTAILSNVGMFGAGSGWVVSPPVYNIGLFLGGIAHKPALIRGQVETRQMMSVTLCLNHDIVDGAPAARFAAALKDMVEKGKGIEEIEFG